MLEKVFVEKKADSECVERQKICVISGFLTRAYEVTINWKDKLKILTIFINNKYSSIKIDKKMEKFLYQKFNNQHYKRIF